MACLELIFDDLEDEQDVGSPSCPHMQKPHIDRTERSPKIEGTKAALNAGNLEEVESLKGPGGILSVPTGKRQGTPPKNWDDKEAYPLGHTIEGGKRGRPDHLSLQNHRQAR